MRRIFGGGVKLGDGMMGVSRREAQPVRVAGRSSRIGICILAMCAMLMALGATGCVSPVALHRAVLEYDRAVSDVESEMLLLNIARARHHRVQHFTGVSSVAATFEFGAQAGLSKELVFPGSDTLGLSFGGSFAEKPTITIVPIQGEEFTSRILTPFDGTRLAFLIQQGVEPSVILRLMGAAILVSGYGESATYQNLPNRVEEYREFRRRVMQLSSLNRQRRLQVAPLLYEETLALPLKSAGSDVVKGLDKVLDAMERGYEIDATAEEPSLTVRRRVVGRVVMTNYDPYELPNEERRLLDEEAQRYPRNYVLVDIRPDGPGGDYPLHGFVVLRSFNRIMSFLGAGIGTDREFHVEKDPRTGRIDDNPPSTLGVAETTSRPSDAAFAVKYEGLWYSIRKAPLELGDLNPWDQETFRVLSQLYQMTVTDISHAPAPSITIAK